jgi:hypothetical protein
MHRPQGENLIDFLAPVNAGAGAWANRASILSTDILSFSLTVNHHFPTKCAPSSKIGGLTSVINLMPVVRVGSKTPYPKVWPRDSRYK